MRSSKPGAASPRSGYAASLPWLLLLAATFCGGLLVDRLSRDRSPARASPKSGGGASDAAQLRLGGGAAARRAKRRNTVGSSEATEIEELEDEEEEAAARLEAEAEEAAAAAEEEEYETSALDDDAAVAAPAPKPAKAVPAAAKARSAKAAPAAAARPAAKAAKPAARPAAKAKAAKAKPKGKPARAAAVHQISEGAPPSVPAGEPKTITFADGHAVRVYPHAHYDWWSSVSEGWEADSLRALKFFLTLKKERVGHSIEVDFGCWIGPTVLFSAPYADAVWAMEPDADAFREAYHNVKLNPEVAAKTNVQQLCISDKAGAIKMYGRPGDSMSTLIHETKDEQKKGYTSWQVECMTFDAWIEWRKIDPSHIGIIKLDTEGAEARILVQLEPWLRKHKPTILLSMHAFLYLDDAVAHAKIKEVLYSYKTLLLSTNGLPVDRDSFTVPGWCRLCTLILTEEELPSQFASWEEALSAAAPAK